MRTGLPVFLFLFVLLACQEQVKYGNPGTRYFSMDSLVDHQVTELLILQPELNKEANLDSVNEKATIYLDSLGWENELKIFRESDIDKPSFYGLYSLKSAQRDSFSNLLFDEYLASNQDNLTVKSLKVYYLDSRESIKKVEILITDQNELFESQRNLMMTFEDRKGKSMLSSYLVKGDQKLKLNQRVTYEISGTLNY